MAEDSMFGLAEGMARESHSSGAAVDEVRRWI